MLLLFVVIEIQNCCHGLWLAETFSTSSQEPLLWGSLSLPLIVPFVVLKKCCYFLFWSEIQDGSQGRLIGWDIFHFFLRITAWMIAKLFTNVPFRVLKKCCYFSLWSENENGRCWLWFTGTFTTSEEPLHWWSLNLPKCSFYCSFWPELGKLCFFNKGSQSPAAQKGWNVR